MNVYQGKFFINVQFINVYEGKFFASEEALKFGIKYLKIMCILIISTEL